MCWIATGVRAREVRHPNMQYAGAAHNAKKLAEQCDAIDVLKNILAENIIEGICGEGERKSL